jgi:hypothetical protein
MTTYVIPLLTVLGVGLVLGAGLPAVFAVGLRSYSAGVGGTDEAATAPNPALKFLGLALFAIVGFVIFVALLWITRTTIIHHTGFDPFFGFQKKK